MRAVFPRYAKGSYPESFVWFANLAAFFCTQSNTFILPPFYGPQHETPHARIGRTSDMQTKISYSKFPFWEHALWNDVPSRFFEMYKKPGRPSLNRCVRLFLNTGCPRRNGQNFGRVFLMLNYTDITQNTYIQSWTVTEIMAREVWNFDNCYTLIDYQIHIKTGRNMWFL